MDILYKSTFVKCKLKNLKTKPINKKFNLI